MSGEGKADRILHRLDLLDKVLARLDAVDTAVTGLLARVEQADLRAQGRDRALLALAALARHDLGECRTLLENPARCGS